MIAGARAGGARIMGHMLEFPINVYPFTLEFHIKMSFGFFFNDTATTEIYTG